MADPVTVAITANTWVKVATNVISGNVRILNQSPEYLQSYRDTGGVAPTARIEGAKLDPPGAPIAAISGIDVYVYAIDTAGSVRVDL